MMSCCGGNELDAAKIQEGVKDYYGNRVKSTTDLKTSVCTLGQQKMRKGVKEALSMVHEEVSSRYYGCGLVIPDLLAGYRILDLGSGAGQDCFTLSKLVGAEGHVTGIDMTVEQLEVANKYIDYHTKAFGFEKPNVDFVNGYIEKLTQSGLKENSFDIIVSNCVVNLSPDKKSVLKEAYKVLKVGGEMFFSDVYGDRTLPKEVQENKVVWGECISGALTVQELHDLAAEVGFTRPRPVDVHLITIEDPEIKPLIGDAKFISVTYRLFKLPSEVSNDVDYSVEYLGGIEESDEMFKFDIHHKLLKGKAFTVDSEVGNILKWTRFKDFFKFREIERAQVCEKGDYGFDIFDYALSTKKPATPSGCCSGGKSC